MKNKHRSLPSILNETKERQEEHERNKILLHRIWKNWSNYKQEIYKRNDVSNLGELIHHIRERDISLEEFISYLDSFIDIPHQEQEISEKILKKQYSIITVFDKEYPQELKKLYKHASQYPPLLLYHRGAFVDYNNYTNIAVVGTRKCTEQGRNMAQKVGEFLAKENYGLVTGFAKGIDTAATKGALKEEGKIVEVRPWLHPLDIYSDGKLVDKVKYRGCFLAEHFKKKQSGGWIKTQFVTRNRIIAGIAKLVIVIEARPQGGSMYQIKYGRKKEKPVLIWRTRSEREDLKQALAEYMTKGVDTFGTVKELKSKMGEHLN